MTNSEAEVTNGTGSGGRHEDVLALEVTMGDGGLTLGSLYLQMEVCQSGSNVKTDLDSLECQV